MTLRAACQLNIFDEIVNGNNTLAKLNSYIQTNYSALSQLIAALIEIDTLVDENETLILKEKGLLLTANHPDSLKNSCILWGGEHLTSWQHLEKTVKTGISAFELNFKKTYFEYLKADATKLKNYHRSMKEYATEDYRLIGDFINFSDFNTIVDLGGGLGSLIELVNMQNPEKMCVLFELPEVIKLVKRNTTLNLISGDFFQSLPFKADAIILSRILHDWNDLNSKRILDNCSAALNDNGSVFIIEIMDDEIDAKLLSLNMMAMCESFERTYAQYNSLIDVSGFQIHSKSKLNHLQSILTLKKQ